MEKAFFEPAGFGPETLESSRRRQQADAAVRWVGGVTCNPAGDPTGFAGEVGVANVTNDLLCCSHSTLQGLAAGNGVGSVPHCDAAGQDALSGASVERVHNGGRGCVQQDGAGSVTAILKYIPHM